MIRLTHIFIAMGLILLAGILSARALEGRMGVSAVPGLVLVDCPGLGAGTLEDMRSLWPGSTLEWVTAVQGRFLPFDQPFLARHAAQGDAMALFSAGRLDREAGDVSVWPVVLDGYPGEDPLQRAGAVADSVVEFMEQRPGSRPFVLGVALDEELGGELVAEIVKRLADVARAYPGSRRTALVVLGSQSAQAVAGETNRRWCLRIPIGDWAHRQDVELRDLLETQRSAPSDPGH